MADSKGFTVTRRYVVKVPVSHLDQLVKDYPDTSVEADLIDAATRCADAGNNKGNMYLYRNAEGDLYWLDEPYSLSDTILSVVEYDVVEIDSDYDDEFVETDHNCGHCGTVNRVMVGADLSDYRCVNPNCIQWL